MPDIQAVTLDLWQTLIIDQRDWGRERARIRVEGAVAVLNEAGEHFTEELVTGAYRACYRTCRAVHEEGLDVSFKEQVQIFVRGIDGGLPERISQETFAQILDRYADSFFDAPPVMADGVPEMLAGLRKRGLRIGLISNTGMTPGRLFRAYLEDLGIMEFFDHMTFSDEVLLSKPNKDIFLHSFAGLGCQAERTVHVGDHLRNDIVGAQGVGVRTVWVAGFDTSGQDVTPTATIQHIADLPEALDRLQAG